MSPNHGFRHLILQTAAREDRDVGYGIGLHMAILLRVTLFCSRSDDALKLWPGHELQELLCLLDFGRHGCSLLAAARCLAEMGPVSTRLEIVLMASTRSWGGCVVHVLLQSSSKFGEGSEVASAIPRRPLHC